VIANQHHDEDYGGCEQVGEILETVLVAVLGQKQWKQRTGTPCFDWWHVWQLVTTGLGQEDEKERCRKDQCGQKENSGRVSYPPGVILWVANLHVRRIQIVQGLRSF
jgi:hypothetical protein